MRLSELFECHRSHIIPNPGFTLICPTRQLVEQVACNLEDHAITVGDVASKIA